MEEKSKRQCTVSAAIRWIDSEFKVKPITSLYLYTDVEQEDAVGGVIMADGKNFTFVMTPDSATVYPC